ncbi:XisH protein [Nostoc sp. 'Peltigera membranacea cyanobiont' 210A]|uniref:XisH family protein n=1 Tax=Nostoc sp. 'Peltigera membranacea cyanobiont' 210A TaxID=2014529 RepID=UPI000B954749|nr:XisH family protein [Nostoc sp. 'Peltigera membranacea cyanobiont' 210A]OYD90662.1 XisH protein [Nostoc sp. 'Peltigera membranacea cyanobiont' 210A]
MPAKDVYHDAVKNALIKDGWIITADPYPIKYEEVKLFADLAGEKTIAASREGKQIVIEIKSFLSRSPMRDLETALGQYLIYKAFLSLEYPEKQLYLAIGEIIYEDFFQKVAIKFILEKYQVSLLVVDMNKQEIVKWIS